MMLPSPNTHRAAPSERARSPATDVSVGEEKMSQKLLRHSRGPVTGRWRHLVAMEGTTGPVVVHTGGSEITVFQILKCCCSSRLLYYIHPVNVSKMKGNSLSNSHSAHLNPHCELNWTVQEAGGRTFKTLFPAKFNRAIVFPTHYLVIHMNHLLVKSKFRFFMNAVYIWNIMNSCPKNTHTRNT